VAKSLASINNFLQLQLKLKSINEITLLEAATLLHDSGYLKDSKSSPGFPLRRLILANKIKGSVKKNNYFWYLKRIENYRELISPVDLCNIIGFKNIKSLYRKIKRDSVPHLRLKNGQILFYKDEIFPWLINNKYLSRSGVVHQRNEIIDNGG
jgi:hypothetical protein